MLINLFHVCDREGNSFSDSYRITIIFLQRFLHTTECCRLRRFRRLYLCLDFGSCRVHFNGTKPICIANGEYKL